MVAARDRRLADLRAEPDRIGVGDVEFLAHVLVVPSPDPEETKRFDAEVEAVAMRIATAYEESFHAKVKDVSRPALARRAGLTDWPGFDLLSARPDGQRAIEVKGRAGVGEIEVSENEWAKACNLRDRYWLYVVFDCATSRPRLIKIRDPFGRLLATAKGSVIIAGAEILYEDHTRTGDSPDGLDPLDRTRESSFGSRATGSRCGRSPAPTRVPDVRARFRGSRMKTETSHELPANFNPIFQDPSEFAGRREENRCILQIWTERRFLGKRQPKPSLRIGHRAVPCSSRFIRACRARVTRCQWLGGVL